METNALHGMKASSKGKEITSNTKKLFGRFNIPPFSGPLISEAQTTSSKYKLHRPCVSIMQLSFHKPIACYKQITHSQDKQSCAKTQLPVGQKDEVSHGGVFINHCIRHCLTERKAEMHRAVNIK